MINTVEMQKVIRNMLECTEVPKALRRHMYNQIRIVQRKRQTVGGGLATQSKFAAEAQYNTEPECTCSAAGSEFTRIGEHVCMMMMALLIRNSLAALINYVLGPYAGSQ